jgi:hypothetical protein
MNPNDLQYSQIGIGSTEELSLRVSAATLSKVLFEHPESNDLMLALERTATWRKTNGDQIVVVKVKPFGGGIRLKDPSALQALVGGFHFDSLRSQDEMDFRIQIRPQDWESVQIFCLQQFQQSNSVLESSPERELLEEFEDALEIRLTTNDYLLKPLGVVVENTPSQTDNVRAPGSPTVRIYKLFEVRIASPRLIAAILESSQACKDRDLRNLAWKDKKAGGRGRANAVLALPYDLVTAAFQGLPPENRGEPVQVMGHQLDSNVLAILDGIESPKYQRIINS